MTARPLREIVALLAAQAVAFGITLALLLVPANAVFLDTYGAKWLPATYVAIAVVGTALSVLVARAARRTRLVRVASVTLGLLAVAFLASWLILAAGGAWVSAALLVAFPIALQAGFVFIGGQAGRLLDVRQLKELFPRIVSGFAIGFLLGGLLAVPLLAWLGSTENLLIGTTIAQIAFLALLLVTESRHPEVRATPSGGVHGPGRRPPLSALFAGLTLLLLVYQVLSAMGSQVVDYLLFDRAAANYSGDDLTRFLSLYTAALNLVDILFLALVAGPLLRRFGLRLGLVLNPAVVLVILGAMALVAAGPGAATVAMFALAGTLRIADIAATDGTTRTSVNAGFQVVPPDDRLAVQAIVEGVGVPVAIGLTGVLLLLINQLELGVAGVVVFGLALAALWTVVAVLVYRSYREALTDEVSRRRLLDESTDVSIGDDVNAVASLLRADDVAHVRLGLDLAAAVASPSVAADLRHVAARAEPAVRAQALARLAALGDAVAAEAGGALVIDLARAPAPSDRRAAAVALAAPLGAEARHVLGSLLGDPDLSVRRAALDAVADEDAGDPGVLGAVVAAAGDPRTVGGATAAARRLGSAVAPVLLAAIVADRSWRRATLVRAAAAVAADGRRIDVLAPALDDRDRTIVLAAMESLEAAGGFGLVPSDVVAGLVEDAARLTARALAARGALAGMAPPLLRALDDEVVLARRLAVATLAAAHGPGIREAARVIDLETGQRRALAVETLDVLLSRREAALALPVARGDLSAPERLEALRECWPAGRSAAEWLDDLVHDPEHAWRSPWLAACAAFARQAGSAGDAAEERAAIAGPGVIPADASTAVGRSAPGADTMSEGR